MDVLIEVLVALLKGLFGEQEKPADMSNLPGKRRTRSPRSDGSDNATGNTAGGTVRGPYQYGDESSRPKTLEEILAEVRSGAAQNTQRPVTSTAPEIRAEVKTPRQTLRLPKPVAASVSVPLAPPISSATSSDTLQQRELKSTLASNWDKRAFAKAQQLQSVPELIEPSIAAREIGALKESRISHVNTVDVAQECLSNRGERSGMKAGEMLRSLQKATPATRQAAAREAFIFQEVFGLPRSRKAIRG